MFTAFEKDIAIDIDEEGQPIAATAHSGGVSLTLRPNKMVYVVAEGITLGFHCQSLQEVLTWAAAMKNAGKDAKNPSVLDNLVHNCRAAVTMIQEKQRQ